MVRSKTFDGGHKKPKGVLSECQNEGTRGSSGRAGLRYLRILTSKWPRETYDRCLLSTPLFFRFNRPLEMNFSSRDGRRFFLPPTTGQRSCVLALVTAISWTWRNITKGEAKHEKVARGTLVVRLGRRSGEMDRGSPMGIRYTRITGCVINRCKRWRHESLPI